MNNLPQFTNEAEFNQYCEETMTILRTSGEIGIRWLARAWEEVLEEQSQNQTMMGYMDKLFSFVKNQCNELISKNENIKNVMKIKIPEHFYKIYPNDDEDINVPEPLERQINGMPEFEEGSIISNLLGYMFGIRYQTRKMYTYLSLYLDKINVKMQYLKSQIIKAELGRKLIASNTLNTLDCIINHHMYEYIRQKSLFNEYSKKLNEVHLDDDYMLFYLNYYNGDVNNIMVNYYEIHYNTQYKLHISALDEARKKPEIWNLIVPKSRFKFN